MVSAISVCLLALGLTAASSQSLSSDADYPDAPISERRTFKHGKPVKLLPLVKKHKKFAGFVPHVFGKTQYTEIPVVHEPPKPIYKVHRYQGIEVKPVPYSTPEPIIESHSIEGPSDFEGGFTSDHSFPPSPIISSPYYVPQKPLLSFAPPPQAIFSSIPITIPSSPAFSSLSIARPAVISQPAPVFAPIPANPPPQPIFSPVPIKIQTSVLPAPSPSPVFPAVPIKIQPPVLPVLPGPSPAPVVVKIPTPVLPASPAPSPAPVVVKIPTPVLPAPSPAPVFHNIPPVSPTPGPVLSSFPTALPPTFSIPSPVPSVQVFPSFPSISATPEPEFPYPPSGTPIPSYIKDISLSDIDVKVTPAPAIETLEVTPTVEDGPKTIEHSFGGIKHDGGFFQKIKGWKVDKANAALSHLAQFKQKPTFHSSTPIVNKIPEIPTSQLPIHPSLQFSSPVQPLPLAPAQIFFPPSQFNSPVKYESFPPNNIESPPLFNSYGVPIPHDSYSPPHISHDRLSSAASEEEPAVVAAPVDKKEQNVDSKPQLPHQEFQSYNIQPQFQTQSIPHEHPIYVAEKTVTEENKTNENQQPEIQNEQNSQDVISNYPNHKE